uniref:DB domain-containing protein n=1 Tax=Panagrolaimus sp. PS1159 TaxID=55785 RepID=A0AC35FQ22_9BILA
MSPSTKFSSSFKLLCLIYFLTSLISTVSSYGEIQCNIGLKLYSVESGRAVCSTFAHYGCIESCEWNTTCTKTSHYTAFKGRRTYVTGMILTNNNFLLQCCSSLATIVQMNSKKQPVCVWTSWANSVEEGGSIRMDPPLSKSEYIRDILLERIEDTGKVKVKLEICKFLTQRTMCNREKMPVEDRHQYSLLLLRLYRTQIMLNSTGTLSQTAKEAIDAAGLRPASAAFSVVSHVDERREIGNILTGVAGGDISAEEKLEHIRTALQHMEPLSTATPLPSPQLNTAFWDNQSGVPKSHTQSPNLAPPGMTPPSSFNFDIIPSASEIPRRPINAGRRLATNATRESVTRYSGQVKDDPTQPLRHQLAIKRIGNNRHHDGEVRMRTSQPTFIRETEMTTVTEKAFTIPLKADYWKTKSFGIPKPSPSPASFAPAALPRQIRPAPVKELLACCQAQAPGCRQLCSKDVSKDEIKRALLTQQCPPLSMTSVISCFPQYYDTSSVGVCCSLSPNLPPQCQQLCQPNFKPSLTHLVCIDHISTIVECYRDLIR